MGIEVLPRLALEAGGLMWDAPAGCVRSICRTNVFSRAAFERQRGVERAGVRYR